MANNPLIFEVNVNAGLRGVFLTEKETRQLIGLVLDNVSGLFLEKWRSKARQNLRGTRQAYIRALFKNDPDWNIRVVGLRPEATLANMIELGAGAFDMKDGFRRSPKRKMKVGGKGWYLTIPMRFAGAGAIGESEAFSGVLPDDVYQIAKKQTPTKTQGSQIIQQGNPMKLEDIPKRLRQESTKREEIAGLPKEIGAEYIHKSNIYEGLTRIEKLDSPKQSMYMTFRRVSDTSDPNSWIHKGFTAKNFAGKTFTEMNSGEFSNIVENTIDQFLANRRR